MQFYRPLSPQRRLSSILAELPKDSKVASQIVNFAAYITKDLMQKKTRKIGFNGKKDREKLDLMEKKEREKLDLMGKKEQREKSELSKHITNLENEVKSFTIKRDIRSQDKTISFRESTDNVLKLEKTCILNNSQYKDVERCMGGLYHTASKNLHGHDKDIEIDARDWSVNEAGRSQKYYAAWVCVDGVLLIA
ncbi:16876_t:CDS:2 [Gigaspora rosea]|nr:16876_t:CDS:2 [Gigaspora rosea]